MEELVITNELKPENTIDASDLLGKKVLSKSGHVIGRIHQIRINQKNFGIEGITVKRGFSRKIYIGYGYIYSISDKAVILNIELSLLLKSKVVVDYHGKILGKVKEIIRKGDKNDIDKIIVQKFLRKDMEVPIHSIKTISKSIILKESYNVKQRYFWKKS